MYNNNTTSWARAVAAQCRGHIHAECRVIRPHCSSIVGGHDTCRPPHAAPQKCLTRRATGVLDVTSAGGALHLRPAVCCADSSACLSAVTGAWFWYSIVNSPLPCGRARTRAKIYI